VNIELLGNNDHIMNVYLILQSDSTFLTSKIDALISQIIC